MAHQTGFFLIPLLVISTLNIEQFNRILRLTAWAGLPIAFIGLLQYWGLAFPNIPSNASPSATFYHRNAAATYIICILPLTTLGLFKAKTNAHTIYWGLLLTVQGTFLLSTRTRGAWVAIAVAGIATLILSKIIPQLKHQVSTLKSRALAGVCFLILLSTLLPENIHNTSKVGFDEKKSDAITTITSIITPQGHRGRVELWANTLKMIRTYPLGVGLGNWQYWYPYFALGEHINVKAAPERPHNDLLWITAELGIIGLLSFATILISAGFILYQILKVPNPHHLTALSLMAIVIAYLIEGLFSFPRAQIMPNLYFWFALGGLALINLTHKTTHKTPTAQPAKYFFLFAIPLLCLSIQITFKRIQYDRHHLKVHTSERTADWTTVIEEANQAYQYGTLRANTSIAHGRALYRTREFLKAKDAYTIALTRHPYSLNAYNNLGIVHRRLGEYNHAISAFKNALNLFPNFIEAHFNMGLAYIDQEKWDEALKSFSKAESLGLKNPHLYFYLGQIYHLRKNLPKAQDYYMKSLEQHPQFEPAQRALSQLSQK
ncbi:MAG: tetratricopeptide repeat protein [Candidatus Latescibacteria bacterium]|nr:tetratricopeptide repeat protein [Candidatus Latescibacterota bacterium]